MAIALLIITEDAVGHWCCQGMLLSPVQSAVRQASQTLFQRPYPPALRPQPVVLQGALLSPTQGLILVPVVFHKVIFGPFLQLASTSLNGSSVLKHCEWSLQFVATCKLGKIAIHHLLQVIVKDV